MLAPLGQNFKILECFRKVFFFIILDLQKVGSPEKTTEACGFLGDFGAHETGAKEGEGGGKPPPRLGGLGRSEDRKDEKLGGSEERGSERREVRRIKRIERDLHADPVGR